MTCLTKEAVEALIPHRDPFLFVESAEVIDRNLVRGTCRWSPESAIFKGHFPGFPIVPGVLAVEAAAQLAGTLLVHRADQMGQAERGNEETKMLGVLIGIKRASFHRPVLPGRRIYFDVKVGNPVGGMVAVEAIGQSQTGQKVCKCELSIALVNKADLVAGVAAEGSDTTPCEA